MKHRIQINVDNKLIAEVISDNYEYLQNIWYDWCAIRYLHGNSLGCCSIQLDSIPRLWL